MNEYLYVYGFGSFFRKSIEFQDVDILIIHQSSDHKSCQLAIWCKRMLLSKIPNADITMLSVQEEQQHSFIVKSNACLIGKVCKSSAEIDVDVILSRIKKLNVIE